jgi:hypothetical protein
MIDYKKAFSPSFTAKTFTTEEIPGIDYSFGSKLNLSNINFGKLSSLAFNPIAFAPGTNFLGGSSQGWTFITAPEDISWDLANQANRVDMFGTNNPPVVSGSRGMRDLTLGNALVEGFVRGKQVEEKIKSLESLMSYSLNSTEGFVTVPVYQVWANKKPYGGEEGYYIIKDIKVKETMRDLSGNSTRAYVDISLMQVPAYQVASGRDQASKPTAGAKSALISKVDEVNKNRGKNAASNAATAQADNKVKAVAGASVPGQAPAKAPGNNVGEVDVRGIKPGAAAQAVSPPPPQSPPRRRR